MIRIRRTENDSCVIIAAETLDDIISAVVPRKNKTLMNRLASLRRGRDWYGQDCLTYDDAEQFSASNWPEGAERSGQLAAGLEMATPIVSARYRQIRGPEG